MYTYRRRTAAEIDDAARLIAQVFAPEQEEAATSMLSMAFQACPFMPIEQVWLLLEEGRPVFQWQMLDFQVRIGTATVRAAGAFAVANMPGQAGKQHMKTAYEIAGHMPAAEGFDLVVGFARRGRAFTQMQHTVDLGAEYTWSMDVPEAPVALQGFTRGSDADAATIVELSNAANLGRPISIVRTAEMWPWMQRKPAELWLGDGGYLGLRDGEGCLEVREVAGRSLAFYAQALQGLFALAQARGQKRLMGHLPPDHPLVQLSQHHGAEMVARHDLRSGSFVGLMRPRAFMEKVHPELQERWSTAHAGHALALTLHTQNETFTQHFNSTAPERSALELHIAPGGLLQLCLGYSAPQVTLRQHHGRTQATGVLTEEAVLSALFPQGHPFVAHTDRW